MASFISAEHPADILEAEDDQDYLLSDNASSFNSDTTSVASSIYNYTYENGRRYHAFRAGKYVLPNDEKEQDRLDLQHHLWGLLLGGRLVLAPLEKEKVKRVLDVGTGTGIWAMDFGDDYRHAEVIGCDLSPIQPHWVPPNVKFEVDDIEEDWSYNDGFDLIHVRTMVGSIKNWDKFFERAYENLHPGGYIELHESDVFHPTSDDGTFNKSLASWEYYENFNKGMKALGVWADVSSFGDKLAKQGFVDVVVKRIKFPLAAWAKKKELKEQGRISYEMLRTGVEAYGLAVFTRALDMDEDKAKELIQKTLQEHGDPRVHIYGYQYIIYAKKPE